MTEKQIWCHVEDKHRANILYFFLSKTKFLYNFLQGVFYFQSYGTLKMPLSKFTHKLQFYTSKLLCMFQTSSGLNMMKNNIKYIS